MRKKKLSAGKVGCLVVVILLIAAVIGIFRLFSAQRSLPESFVLTLELSGDLAETAGPAPPLPFVPGDKPLSLQDIVFLLQRAGEDSRVRSVLLDVNGLGTASAKIQQLQRAVEKTRKAGKPVNAFLRNASDQDVWLGSVCDTVIAERGNFLLLDGLRAELLFFTETLEKLGVSFQAAQWSAWKSGVEPFTRSGASPEYRRQVETTLDSVYAAYTASMTGGRGISSGTYRDIIDRKTLLSAGEAKKLGIVDEVGGRWEYLEKVKRSFGKDGGNEKNDDVLVDGRRYKAAVSRPYPSHAKERIAVITASGPIVRSAGGMPAGSEQGFDEETLRRSVRSALDDESVKAIVLRIDSPGGDALASSNMLQILDSARVKKPVVSSMSSVAASGGYMIALAADSIFAEPLTVTGSIGVYALKPEISKLQEKIALNREVLTRGRNADAFTLFKPLDEAGMAKFMEATGWIYDDFLAKVASSRKMKRGEVEALAGGRIWMGSSAVENGLVDRIGGLQEAIRAAQFLGGIDSATVPGVTFYPEPQGVMEYLLGGAPDLRLQLFDSALPEGSLADRSLRTLDLLRRLERRPGGMSRMTMLPYELRIE